MRGPEGGVRTPGFLLGVGMGGFVDGIVLHQILQWHQMLSTTERFGSQTLDDVQANVVADGFFHVATWIAVAVGLAMLWRTMQRHAAWRGTWRSLVGWMLVGWGAFNIVEGVIDHHVLGIHRVRPDAADPMVWDIGFLVLGLLLIVGGYLLQRSDTAGRDAGDPARRAAADVDA